MRQFTIAIKETHLQFAVILIIAVLLFVLIYQRIGNSGIFPVPQAGMNLTSAEAKLVRSAIEVALDDVELYRNIEQARRAFGSMLPEKVRERVLQELGEPELSSLRDALMVLDGKVMKYER